MNGIVFDIKRFTIHDGPGIRTTVFLKGCPLHCSWCHNPESIGHHPCKVKKTLKLNGKRLIKEEIIGYEISADQLFAELEKERVFMDESGGGVTFSGGEPLFQNDFLLELLKTCKQAGIHTAVDTSLFAAWEKIKDLLAFTDLFLVDLKLMDSAAHQLYTGSPNEMVLDNIRKLVSAGATLIIRSPVIPAVTDSSENIAQTISFLHSLEGKIKEVHLLPFHNTAKGKYISVGKENAFGNLKSLQKEEMLEIKRQYADAGFIVKIGG
ncbi:MAG: glycyl-radical enzyme activating protein [Tannerella sp.]|jgi:pyruvate formate lyase activating enzyme|nr:glycyl-radical enzyme activating protein [Tannerella sp.]